MQFQSDTTVDDVLQLFRYVPRQKPIAQVLEEMPSLCNFLWDCAYEASKRRTKPRTLHHIRPGQTAPADDGAADKDKADDDDDDDGSRIAKKDEGQSGGGSWYTYLPKGTSRNRNPLKKKRIPPTASAAARKKPRLDHQHLPGAVRLDPSVIWQITEWSKKPWLFWCDGDLELFRSLRRRGSYFYLIKDTLKIPYFSLANSETDNLRKAMACTVFSALAEMRDQKLRASQAVVDDIEALLYIRGEEWTAEERVEYHTYLVEGRKIDRNLRQLMQLAGKDYTVALDYGPLFFPIRDELKSANKDDATSLYEREITRESDALGINECGERLMDWIMAKISPGLLPPVEGE